MLDITNNKSELTSYGGSELKKTYYIDNHNPIREKNISYINNQYSKYFSHPNKDLKNAIKIRYDLILLPAWKVINYEN